MGLKSKKGGAGAGIILVVIVIVIIFAGLSSCLGCEFSSSHSDETCQVCGRTFNWDSENASSIRRTNMCTTCYSNYKWAREQAK